MIFILQCKYLQLPITVSYYYTIIAQLLVRFYQCYHGYSLVSSWPYLFNLNIIADSQWCELEMEMNKLYHQAVEQVPTGELCTSTLDVKHVLTLLVYKLASTFLNVLRLFSCVICVENLVLQCTSHFSYIYPTGDQFHYSAGLEKKLNSSLLALGKS